MPSTAASLQRKPPVWAETRRKLDDLLRAVGLRQQPSPAQGLVALATALMSRRGVPSGPKLAAELLNLYFASDEATRRAFLVALPGQLSLDRDRIERAIQAWGSDRGFAGAHLLHAATRSPVRQLIEALNLAPDGTRGLLRMREDLLDLVEGEEGKRLDGDFADVFATWFNAGFLELRPLDWQSPAAVLEKVIAYEAVHAIEGWDDLRARTSPLDRRCYAFFHPRIPDEPLIFIEVALTRGLPSSLEELMADPREVVAPPTATSAIFYSISNCQRGLKGIPFGALLIKRVVGLLLEELPHLSQFATLSPVPGLASWLKEAGLVGEGNDRRALAARYLLRETTAAGDIRDPVARFHLGNGARLEAVHLCPAGRRSLASSADVMVNYVYDLPRVEANYLDLTERGAIAASRAVLALANTPDR